MQPPRKGELEATQQTVRFFETLLRASTDGIVITDATQSIVMVNDAFCAFFGQRWRDVVETSLFTWIEKLDRNSLGRWAELEKCVHFEGACGNVEFQMISNKGVRHFSVNASMLERVADEERGVIISIWRDVTDLRGAEEALRRANEELERRVQERTSELVSLNELLRQEIKIRKRVEKVLRKSEEELESKSLHLEEVNTALKILLQQIEKDKRDLEESILSNIRILVLPYIERLKKSRLNINQMNFIEMLQSNLNQIVSPFLKTLTSKFLGLTPLELKIADMVKEGKTTKEIAQILFLSVNTVSSYRYRLRCKLGLKNTKTNLYAYLQSLSE
jgi:PAS domain S-box-containing protein